MSTLAQGFFRVYLFKMENILSTVERMRADGVEDEEIERVVRLMEESRHRT